MELFTQKFATKLRKVWGWDPGSEIRDPEKKPIPDPGPGSKSPRIRIRSTAYTSSLKKPKRSNLHIQEVNF